MYSDEIQKWLSDKNYVLSKHEYLWLITNSGSTQIDHIKYNPYSGDYHIWTNDGFFWRIQVKQVGTE